MRPQLPWWLLCLSATAFGQVSNVQITGATATQAILSYTAPDSALCTVEVSSFSDFQTLVHDVDPTLFFGSNRDDRFGNISVGQQRVFVIGARRTERTPTGAKYSRALQADAAYYFRITCGSDTAVGSFRTGNIPLGSIHIETLETDPATPGSYLDPSSNPLLQPEVIDPRTGVLVKNVNTLGWAYAGVTPVAGASFTAAEDPSGKWTDPANVLKDDGAATSYSGNSQDWLWLRLPPFPGSSTFSVNTLSFQNIQLKGSCSGPDCGAGGETIEVCITRIGIDEDGPHCEAPVREVNLGSDAQTIALCGDGAPCQNPATPGDLITYDALPQNDSKVSRGYVYNDQTDYKKLFFTLTADCKRLRQNDAIALFNTADSANYQASVASLDCTAQTPSAVVQSAVRADVNGSGGIPFYYPTGVSGNVRYGVLVRKKSATAQSTINLDWVGWRAASAVSVSFAFGSGGFNRVCSRKPDANGFYHCFAGNSIITGVRTEPDGSLTVRFLGMAYLTSLAGVKPGFQFFGATTSDFLWDDNDANVIYSGFVSSYPGGGLVVAKITYTGNDIECGQPGALCKAAAIGSSEFARWPQLPAKYELLTPCLGGCASPDDDYTLQAQFERYTRGKDVPYSRTAFPNCGISAVQGNTLIAGCSQNQQDSFGWIFALDLGNGKPIGAGYAGNFSNTQHVFAANPAFARAPSRWCTMHTYQNIRAEGIATPEFQNEKTYPFSLKQTGALPACSKQGAGTCDPCPPVVVNGIDYTGKRICGALNTDSAWDSAWDTAPDAWHPGEPVSLLSNLHWLQPLAVGDALIHGGEELHVIQKIGPAQYIVERGVGADQTYQYPRAHADGSVWTTTCDPAGAHWFYETDPDATGAGVSYFPTLFVNHAFGRDGVRVHPDYYVSLAPFNKPAEMQQALTSAVQPPSSFAGKPSMAFGNSIEKHPSYDQEDAAPEDQRWFIDAHPYFFPGNAGASAYAAVRISGDLYKYRHTGSIDPKQYELAAFSGQYPLTEVSGPGSIITGETSDAYKVCYAWRAGECTDGSQARDVYFNVPALDTTTSWCREGEFYSGWRDICIANFNVLGASYAQWGLPSAEGVTLKNFSRGRVLSRLFEPYRGQATLNAKPTPDGKWMMFRSNLIAQLPPFPQPDEYDRANFIPMVVSVTPPPDMGVDNVVVAFGYDPSNFYCTNRREACVSTTPAFATDGFDVDNPFWFAQSDLADKGGPWDGKGLPCASGCNVAIPGLPQRVLYYQVIYRDGGNVILRSDAVQVVAVEPLRHSPAASVLLRRGR
ncbi:MAG TPA: hypothetical protein VGF59_10125 [Bryobacteraceae bacterium]